MHKKKKIKFLVTGIGRSGTVFMARLLTSAGIMCGHESIFSHEGLEEAIKKLQNQSRIYTSHVSLNCNEKWYVSYDQIAESSYLSAPFLKETILSDAKIIHITRDPLKVISSHCFDVNFFREDLHAPYHNFVYKHLPELKRIENHIEKCTAYYIWWNQLIEKNLKDRDHLKIKVEDATCPELFSFLNVPFPKTPFDDFKINCWNVREKDLTLEEIPEGDIKKELIETINKYGYKNLQI